MSPPPGVRFFSRSPHDGLRIYFPNRRLEFYLPIPVRKYPINCPLRIAAQISCVDQEPPKRDVIDAHSGPDPG